MHAPDASAVIAFDAALPSTPSIVVSVPRFMLAPGDEIQSPTTESCLCLNNDQPLFAKKFEIRGLPGLHHSQAYVGPCSMPTVLGEFAFGSSAGASSSTWTFPGDVVYQIPARSRVCLSYHYVNVTSDPIPAELELGIYTVPSLPGQIIASAFTLNTEVIDLPPVAQTSVSFDCRFPRPITLLSVIPHTHLLGKRLTVSRTLDR